MAEDKDEVKAQIPKAEDVTIIIQPILIQNLTSQILSVTTVTCMDIASLSAL